jgi:hypothetical protein
MTANIQLFQYGLRFLGLRLGIISNFATKYSLSKSNTMKNRQIFTKLLLAIALVFAMNNMSFGQCVIPIAPGQSYIEDFQSGQMECWTVETTSSATWAVMQGAGSNVVAFQNASAGQEARLVSPTFDLTGSNSATLSFAYAMMALYPPYDELTVSYRTSPSDNWHQLATYSLSDWSNTYDASFVLDDLSSTFQVSFLGYSNGGYYIFIDDIEIASAGGCARPVNLQATEITATSALLGWSTTGNEESWTIDINGHQTTVSSQPYLMDRLEPNMVYTFRVRANCGGGMESEWSQPTTFKTLCDVIVVTDEVPYFDDFEASDDFVCWENQIEAGDDGWVVDPGYLFPNNTAFFIWLGDAAWLVSAPLDITAVTDPYLTFKHRQRSLGVNVDELSVWYATSPDDSWHLLDYFTYACEDWEEVTLALPYASETYYIGFRGKSNAADGVYVDDVWVGNDPTVGINESPTFVAMVSPNPTSGNVMVEANATDGEVVVFDLFGRQIMSATLYDGRAELDLSGIVKGVYVARIASETGTTTIKLVKE